MVEIIKNLFNIFSSLYFSELRQRILSSIVLFSLLSFLFFLGNPIFTIFFSLLFSLVLIEFEELTGSILKKNKNFKSYYITVICFFIYNFRNL